MNPIARFVVAAVLAAVITGCAPKAELEKTTAALEEAKAQAERFAAEISSLKAASTHASSESRALNDKLASELAATTKAAEELRGQLAKAKADAAALESNLQERSNALAAINEDKTNLNRMVEVEEPMVLSAVTAGAKSLVLKLIRPEAALLVSKFTPVSRVRIDFIDPASGKALKTEEYELSGGILNLVTPAEITGPVRIKIRAPR